MAVFISYSHEDKDFVDLLAINLVKAKANVWVDRWELHVGDSILNRIQDAITEADALVVVLSKASVGSEWCKKELTAGLVRELEEKRVLVLPVLLDDCQVPVFLRDKLYADFREDPDDGLRQVLESLEKVISTNLGRVDDPEWYVDWAVDWFHKGNLVHLRLTLLEQAVGQPYSVLTEVMMLPNESFSARYYRYAQAGFEEAARQIILEALIELEEVTDMDMLLEDSLPVQQVVTFQDKNSDKRMDVTIVSRRLGEDTGRDVLIHVGQQIQTIVTGNRGRLRKLSEEESARINEILNHP